jgi:hypothetical protein
MHGYFVEEIGRQNVSEFFRLVEEELLAQPGEDRNLSLRLRAAKATEAAKHRFFQQRRLIQDEETQKAEAARRAAERKSLIEIEVRQAVKQLDFKREWIRDPPNMNFSHHRKQLEDLVTFAVGQDLQFKVLQPIVVSVLIGDETAPSTDGVS